MIVFTGKLTLLSAFFLFSVCLQSGIARSSGPPTFIFNDNTLTDTIHYRFLSFYIDSSDTLSVGSVVRKFDEGQFRMLENRSLNIGLNPHPLWIALPSKYTGSIPKTYWWSFYTHADSMYVYESDNKNKWVLTDILSFKQHITERTEPNRFLTLLLNYKPGEEKYVFVKIIHQHNPQNFITSFSVPKHTLFWERNFYWTVGVFVGLSLMVFIYSLIAGLFSLRRIFFVYALYLLMVTVLCLREEILVPILPKPVFELIIKISDIHIALLCLCLSFYTISGITGISVKRQSLSKILNRVVNAAFLWTLVSCSVHYLFYDTVTVGNGLFMFSWNLGIFLIVLLNLCIAAAIIAVSKRKTFIFNIIAAGLLIYFNAGGYFLNYEGVFKYYEITYPNFFYGVLLLEYITLGTILSWQYSHSLKRQKELTREKAQFETVLYQRELAAEKKERALLAQNLHDELAASLSTIKLFVSNNYKHDQYLMEIVNKANMDVRLFLNRLSDKHLLEKGIISSLEDKVRTLNNLHLVKFQFMYDGEEEKIPQKDIVHLYWIANELLSNILRHSYATDATIQLMIDEEEYRLMTEDNGRGMDAGASQGLGLKNIYNRAKSMGAVIHISSSRAGTTTIFTQKLTS